MKSYSAAAASSGLPASACSKYLAKNSPHTKSSVATQVVSTSRWLQGWVLFRRYTVNFRTSSRCLRQSNPKTRQPSRTTVSCRLGGRLFVMVLKSAALVSVDSTAKKASKRFRSRSPASTQDLRIRALGSVLRLKVQSSVTRLCIHARLSRHLWLNCPDHFPGIVRNAGLHLLREDMRLPHNREVLRKFPRKLQELLPSAGFETVAHVEGRQLNLTISRTVGRLAGVVVQENKALSMGAPGPKPSLHALLRAFTLDHLRGCAA